MIILSGYQVLSKIHESHHSLVYRGFREEKSEPVIFKVLKESYPTPSDLAKYQQEYQILKNLNLDYVIKAYSIEKYQNTLVIILEDFGGESLKRFYQSQPLKLKEFLKIGLKIAEGLANIHGARIIHKVINPTNLVYNPKTEQLKIIDFGISTILPREHPTLQSPQGLEGTLAYISPEQTGRMNRLLDYRTDFYSLGATFYELLTRQPPFVAEDAMELVHCHLARQPELPQTINPKIPPAVAKIILKLLSKKAEDRYQSAWGLQRDLENCLNQLSTREEIVEFPLGDRDISDRFQIPQKLYGREAEIETLLTVFQRFRSQCLAEISCHSSPIEVVLVSGYAGIGKTALVREICPSITEARGYFIAGKFDQYQRDVPYSAIIHACQELIGQLLTESEIQLQQWREKLAVALGENGQVIIDLIPEIELIIGQQPPLPFLPPAEAQNRLNFVFQSFIQVFTRCEHPLVLFLDDLQWADAASLQLLQRLIEESDCQYLFFIGAYRENEVPDSHPLIFTLNSIAKLGISVTNICLKPLQISDINQLICETLACSPFQASSLTEYIFTKTQANPFFVNECLQSLYTEKLLLFNFSSGKWQWDLADIQANDMTDNIVELMALKVQKLAAQSQQILKLAACIGNRFDLHKLALICALSPQETANFLQEAVAEGMILPLADSYLSVEFVKLNELRITHYKFLHDRIRQAAYSLIPESQKPILHRQIGQLLLESIPHEQQQQKIFDIVNHLNLGIELLESQAQHDELAQLNLVAGKRAKSSAAHASAYKYLFLGRQLLGNSGWERQYELMLELSVEASEAAYLQANFEEMERLVQEVLQQAKTLLDKVKVYEIKIQALQAQNQPQAAIKTALPILKQLGVNLPENPPRFQIGLALFKTRLTLLNKRIEAIACLPLMTNPYKLAAMKILASIISAAYRGVPNLMPLIVFEQVKLSLKYGNAPLSAFSYAVYGVILCGLVDDLEGGYRFGKVALRLMSSFNAKEIKAKILYTTNSLILPHQEPLKNTLPALLNAYQIGLETGDFEFACNPLTCRGRTLYFMGEELTSLAQQLQDYSKAMAQMKQGAFLHLNQLYEQVVLNLIGQAEDPCRLMGQAYNEETMLSLHLKLNFRAAIFMLHLEKLVLCYLFDHPQQALENTKFLDNYLDGVIASQTVIRYRFYDSLARLAIINQVPAFQRKEHLKKVKFNQVKLKKWSRYAPFNHLHQFYLVEAEIRRIQGHKSQAMDYYNRAIEMARQYEYLNEEALAYELAAKFYLANHQTKLAQLYMIESRYAYLRWGATAKVQHLDEEYPQLLSTVADDPRKNHLQTTSTSSRTTSRTGSESLDLESVIKASQTLSSEIALNKLLEKLMKILLENAGAEKGFLILNQADNWAIEAESSIDPDCVKIMRSLPIDFLDPDTNIPLLAVAIVNYVTRTQKDIVLNNAAQESLFANDAYIVAHKPKSILCTPLLYQGKLSGILYLENNQTTEAFTPDRIDILRILFVQAAISIENSRLYSQLESYSRNLEINVEERTQEIQKKNEILDLALKKLKATQEQIIAQEKLASLGTLTAGIAHEIKNPLNFVNNFAELSVDLTKELMEEIASQNDKLEPETLAYIDEILQDLKQNAQKIHEHGTRADNIVKGMLMHSRQGGASYQMTDINILLAEATNLAYHGIRAQDSTCQIIFQTDYDRTIKPIWVIPQDINRVLLNMINNACYTANEKKRSIKKDELDKTTFIPTVSISTKNLEKAVEIRIRDNGKGIPSEIKDQIFTPFFTTKPPGRGTGLGLSISYDIIAKEHQGQIRIETEEGNYTEFIIILPIIRGKENKEL